MSSHRLLRFAIASVGISMLSASVAAQQSTKPRTVTTVRLSRVIGAFLVDSGVLTRGLPWTTGNTLPVKWQSSGPVANPDFSARRLGITLARTGMFTGTVGDSVELPMTITLTGTASGLAGTYVNIPSMDLYLKTGKGYAVTREMVD